MPIAVDVRDEVGSVTSPVVLDVDLGGGVGLRAGREVLVDRLVAKLRHQVIAEPLHHQLADRGVRIAEIAIVPRARRAGGEIVIDL